MESELNLDDLQRIVKALVQHQATAKNEEVFLTEGTIKRVIRMGAELETWVKEQYQVKTCGTCDKIVATKGVTVGSQQGKVFCSKDCAMEVIVKRNKEALL